MSINLFETCHSVKWIAVAKAARVSLLVTTVYQTCFSLTLKEKGGPICMYETPVCALLLENVVHDGRVQSQDC